MSMVRLFLAIIPVLAFAATPASATPPTSPDCLNCFTNTTHYAIK